MCLLLLIETSSSSSSPAKLSAAAATLQSLTPPSSSQKVQTSAADLSGADAEANLEAIFKQAGPVEHVVFTAAGGLSITTVQDLTPEGILAACRMRLVAPLLAAKVAARVVRSLYSYSGAGLQGMVRQFAVEPKPGRVNVVLVGYEGPERNRNGCCH